VVEVEAQVLVVLLAVPSANPDCGALDPTVVISSELVVAGATMVVEAHSRRQVEEARALLFMARWRRE
jgi:hypothetical protein